MAGDLKNRSRFGVAIDNKILEELRNLSNETRIPASKLVDEALEDLIIKYRKNPDRKDE